MARIMGFVAGILLLVLLAAMFLPIATETKMVAVIYIWIALSIFTGVIATVFLPNIAVKIASGVVTVAIIAWSVSYLPSIIRALAG